MYKKKILFHFWFHKNFEASFFYSLIHKVIGVIEISKKLHSHIQLIINYFLKTKTKDIL